MDVNSIPLTIHKKSTRIKSCNKTNTLIKHIDMSFDDIISAIRSSMGSSRYNQWTIGVTDDPETRKNQHESDGEDVSYWTQWEADTENIARRVEKYFLDLRMKGGAGGGGDATFVYIF